MRRMMPGGMSSTLEEFLSDNPQIVKEDADQLRSLLAVHRKRCPQVDLAIAASALPQYPYTLGEKPRSPLLQRTRVELALDQSRAEKRQSFAWELLMGNLENLQEAVYRLTTITEVTKNLNSLKITALKEGVIECLVRAKPTSIIPASISIVGAKGNTREKSVSSTNVNLHYQDYLASHMVRVASEIFSVTKAEQIIVSGINESAEGGCLYSTVVTRKALEEANLARIDPSEFLESLQCRGDFKASRRGTPFKFVEPFTITDLSHRSTLSLSQLIKMAEGHLTKCLADKNEE